METDTLDLNKPALSLRKIIFIFIVALLFLAGSVAGVKYYLHATSFISTEDAFIEGQIIPISPKVSGNVLKVHVADNQEVKENDLLVEIDDRDFAVRHEIAKADVQSAQAELNQAGEDAARYKKLLATDMISKQQYDRSKLREDTATAELERAKARLSQAELDLSYTKIMAPNRGHVTRKAVVEGAFIQTGQDLMAIVTPERWVVANFKETQLTHMKPGQKVIIKVDAYPKKDLHGHIDSIQRGSGAKFSLFPPENATGNFVKVVQRIPVKIVFDETPDKNYPLALGMSVIAEVSAQS